MKIFPSFLHLLVGAAFLLTACGSKSDTPQPTAVVLQIESTPLPTEDPVSTPASNGSTKVSEKDGMTLVYVPEGEFTMGAKAEDALAECQKYHSDCQRDWFADEEPPRSVNLDAFWIDQTEVTNKQYSACVEAGECSYPAAASSFTHSSYYGDAEFNAYPVIYVSWIMANDYCDWTGRQLPSEAQWEKAARGADGNTYPWGNAYDGAKVNFCDANCSFSFADKSFDDGYMDVAPVGNYRSGQSVYGALDMAGNVLEWTSSLYQPYPYDATDGREDLTSSSERVMRGGAWSISGDNNVRPAKRYWGNPADTGDFIGFRCAQSK